MARDEMIARLQAHYLRTDMMDTATLYRLIPQIIEKLEDPRVTDREAGED